MHYICLDNRDLFNKFLKVLYKLLKFSDNKKVCKNKSSNCGILDCYRKLHYTVQKMFGAILAECLQSEFPYQMDCKMFYHFFPSRNIPFFRCKKNLCSHITDL